MPNNTLFIPLHNGEIYIRRWAPEFPSGQAPIVLLHDSLGCVDLWRDFPEKLADATQREVIAYDRLGYGQSSPLSEMPALDFIEQESDTIVAVCDALFLSSCVLLGHSVGGGMAVACAARYPERIEAVITVAAQAFVEARTIAGIRHAQTLFGQEGQLARLEKHHGDKAQWALDAWVNTWLDDDFASWNLDAALAQLGCPLFCVHGDSDEYGSEQHPMRFAKNAASEAQYVLLEKCGHVPHREQPAALLENVVSFLARR